MRRHKNNTYSRAERAKLQEAIFEAEKFDAIAEDWADHIMDAPPIEQVVLPRFGQIRPGVLGFTQVIDLTTP